MASTVDTLQLVWLLFTKIEYETKSVKKKKKKKKQRTRLSKVEYYKKLIDFSNIEFHIIFLITQILGQQWQLATY